VQHRRVVVTGIGVVNPLGIGVRTWLERVLDGESGIAPITRFDSVGFPVRVAGEVRGFDVAAAVPRRLAVKTDRFTHFALAATQEALEHAALSLESEDLHRVGVWFGNNSGGWDICERGFKELYREGPALVNPWQATAWFPTAPQGFTTIRYGIKGCSKSLVCDRASGAAALHYALRAIRHGQLDVVLAGGTEAPITSFGMTCYAETGELAAVSDAGASCRPFDLQRSGIVMGEGSTVLVLESREHAEARGARILGELVESAITTDVDEQQNVALERALRGVATALGQVDVVFAEGCGLPVSDRLEAEALARVFGRSDMPVSVPKSAYGHLYGASAATELALGLLCAGRGLVPPTLGVSEPDPRCPVRVVVETERRRCDRFLVQARAREGVNVSLAVRAQA
jgi:3-oxoacyl-[acyl-carrier-protein] synthase II